MAYKIHIKGESPMKASELIKKLQEMVEQHGDCETCYITQYESPYKTVRSPRYMQSILYNDGVLEIE